MAMSWRFSKFIRALARCDDLSVKVSLRCTTRTGDPAPGRKTKESVMSKRQRIALGAAVTAVAVGGLTVAGSAANAQTTSAQPAARSVGQSHDRESEVRANE